MLFLEIQLMLSACMITATLLFVHRTFAEAMSFTLSTVRNYFGAIYLDALPPASIAFTALHSPTSTIHNTNALTLITRQSQMLSLNLGDATQ